MVEKPCFFMPSIFDVIEKLRIFRYSIFYLISLAKAYQRILKKGYISVKEAYQRRQTFALSTVFLAANAKEFEYVEKLSVQLVQLLSETKMPGRFHANQNHQPFA